MNKIVILFALVASGIYGCGGESGKESLTTQTPYQNKATLDIRIFDFIYDGTDYSISDYYAFDNANHRYSLSVGHLLYGTSERTNWRYGSGRESITKLSVASIDRNTKDVLVESLIDVDGEKQTWIFAVGNKLAGRYRLFSTDKPEVQPAEGMVPLFLIDARDPAATEPLDVIINGQTVLSNLDPLTLSPQINVAYDEHLVNVLIARNDLIVFPCLGVDISQDGASTGKSAQARVLILAPDQRCYVKLAS
ncbi:hypothetical protein [Ferrimonas balearica]|uniref:hypothetical protein n=1 Tax=Ferrimonas balearica TaxID=44012 RepID=UPI001C992752|nr:hypothetical protein [Ferrimonas balearica]MBY5997119.1 hypothetical protein [Ferrimonas balearica]